MVAEHELVARTSASVSSKPRSALTVELLQIDIKRLGRFDKVGHRITGDRRRRGRDIGWDHVCVAVDDHSRLVFTQIYPDEPKESAQAFLRASVSYFAKLRVTIERVITDNGKSCHSAPFSAASLELGIKRKFTRIQSALSERAYGRAYESSDQRRHALPAWAHSVTGTVSITASTSSRPSRVCQYLERTY